MDKRVYVIRGDIMGFKSTVVGTIGGTALGAGMGLKKGLSLGFGMGLLAGMTIGVLGTTIAVLGRKKIKESSNLSRQ